ncbi:MAG: hypothetical protein AAGA56_31325 [Myxococcota bacterium]
MDTGTTKPAGHGPRPAENLTPGAAAKRLRYSVLFLAGALVGALVLDYAKASAWYRLALGVPFFMSANGFYQGLYRL